MLGKIFNAARAHLLTEFGDKFFQLENFDGKKARKTLARFFKYYFKQEELVAVLEVDGEVLYSQKEQMFKDRGIDLETQLFIKVLMNEGSGHFSVLIEIYPNEKVFIEELQMICWGELFQGDVLTVNSENYSKMRAESGIEFFDNCPFLNHPIHHLWG